MVFTIAEQAIERKDTGREEVMGLEKIEIVMINAEVDVLTSLFFSLTKPAVRLRHRASTTAPLFSRLTEGVEA